MTFFRDETKNALVMTSFFFKLERFVLGLRIRTTTDEDAQSLQNKDGSE